MAFFSLFDEDIAGTTMQDARRSRAVLQRMASGLDESLASEGRLHGWRVQNLFEALLVCLGSIRLIVTEDAGSYFFDDAGGPVKPPDFRVVRADGEHLLVEVKNVSPGIHDKVRVNEKDLDQERRYAELTGARLVLAHYWSGLNQWTVVDASVLVRRDGRLELPLVDALKANELGLLGDAMIGTRPPLTFDLIADPGKPQQRRESDDNTQEIGFTIGGVEFTCAGRTLADRLEQRIAWFLMLYGRWGSEEVPHLTSAGELERISYVSGPPAEDDSAEQQGFAFVGSLSSMYSTLFNSLTMTDDGGFRRPRLEPDPGVLAALVPADYWSRSSRDLPIWKITQHPASDA